MSIRPLQDRLIVKRLVEKDTSKGGIIIPDAAKEKPLEGKVIAVGNGKVCDDGRVQALDVKVGDTILFSKYAGTEVKIEGEDHLILHEEDVLGVVENAKPTIADLEAILQSEAGHVEIRPDGEVRTVMHVQTDGGIASLAAKHGIDLVVHESPDA